MSSQPGTAPQHGAGTGSRAVASALRLIPLALLIILALAGLHGAVAAPHWEGPLRGDGLAVGVALEVVLGALLAITLLRDRAQQRNPDYAGDDVPGKLRAVLRYVLALGMIAVFVMLLVYAHLRFHANTPPHVLPTVRVGLPTPRSAPKSSTFSAPVGPSCTAC